MTKSVLILVFSRGLKKLEYLISKELLDLNVQYKNLLTKHVLKQAKLISLEIFIIHKKIIDFQQNNFCQNK